MPSLEISEGTVVEAVQFPSGPYRLEGELAYPEVVRVTGLVILAGPHPLLGGSMRNNVVRSLTDGLARHQLATLRFNYRGVGQSEGKAENKIQQWTQFWETSHAPDERTYAEDLDGAVRFLRASIDQELPLIMIGYSFGCMLLSQIQSFSEAAAFVLVAPTVGRHDYNDFNTIQAPKLIIASETDFAIHADQLHAWYARLPEPKQLVQARLDDHFFRGYEDWLLQKVAAFLQEYGR